MMIDASGYDFDAKDDEIALTDKNADDIRNYVNSLM
jgi:hypothetical protein